jgi:serine protease Do
MKLLKIAAFTVTLAGVVALAPSVYGLFDSPVLAQARKQGRELTILGGRGGELGVSISDGKAGVEIDDVHADSAAEKAGLKRGDVILEFDGEHVRSSRQFTRLVQETPSGKSVRATISRDGKKQDVQVTLAEGRESRVILGGPDGRFFDGDALRGFADRMPEFEREFRNNLPNFNYRFDGPGGRGIMSGGRLGITVDELTSQLATYFGAKEGVLVTSVTDGSAAQKAGIKAGDVITSINGDRVNSSSDLIASLRRVENEDVSIGIVRDRKEQTVKAKIEAPRRTIRGARPA